MLLLDQAHMVRYPIRGSGYTVHRQCYLVSICDDKIFGTVPELAPLPLNTSVVAVVPVARVPGFNLSRSCPLTALCNLNP